MIRTTMDYKVSIVVPTYKRSDYLDRAILSLLNQSYQNIEIIVIDDNPEGTDYRKETEKKIEKYSKDFRIKYYKNTRNLGGSLARNEGINKATGQYITFLDDDDEYQSDKILNQLSFMIDHEYDMTFTNLKYVNSNKRLVDYREFSDLKAFDKNSLLKYHIMRHLTGTPTFMYKTEKLKEIGGFDDAKMGQEFFLMIKTIERGLKIAYFNDSQVIAYRHNLGGISQGRNKIKGEKELFEFKKKYMRLFTLREKMFIRFRHYAVMAIAYKRNREYLKFVCYSTIMIISSPIDFIKESIYFIYNINKKRRMEI